MGPLVALLVLLSTALDGAALFALFTRRDPAGIAIALAAHSLAVFLTLRAAHKRRPNLTRSEAHLIRAAAAAIPVMGPALSWAVPRSERSDVRDAHAEFERRRGSRVDIEAYRRTLFSGDFQRDLSRKLDAESYVEVLRRGTPSQKRDCIRRLVDMGERRHWEVIRSCLQDPNEEVRLFAVAELQRVGDDFEASISKVHSDLEGRVPDAAACAELAQLHYDYGASGSLDGDFGRHHLERAQAWADRAALDPDHASSGQRIGALALLALGNLEEAFERIERIADPSPPTEVLLARAEIAYARRDFDGVRQEAQRLKERGDSIPGWLHAMEGMAA